MSEDEELSAFDLLLRDQDADEGEGEGEGEGEDAPRAQPAGRSRRRPGAVLWASIAAVVAGAVVCTGAAIAAVHAPPQAPDKTGAQAAAAQPSRAPGDAGAPDAEQDDRPVERGAVSDLADATWVAALAASTGIPERPLRAYTGAAIAIAEESPSCGLGWNTLAGIGFVESEHGTIHGSTIGDDGVARPAIIGIPLTGEVSLAIRDTDGGALDGDAVWDRAVGPMQFIPETWEQWGTDGNRDGVTDPQNIDDSALAAARYLCAAGGDLSAPDGWIAAIHAYNPSVDYNNRVAEAAEHYGSLAATPR